MVAVWILCFALVLGLALLVLLVVSWACMALGACAEDFIKHHHHHQLHHS
jgi:hypothetical protein